MTPYAKLTNSPELRALVRAVRGDDEDRLRFANPELKKLDPKGEFYHMYLNHLLQSKSTAQLDALKTALFIKLCKTFEQLAKHYKIKRAFTRELSASGEIIDEGAVYELMNLILADENTSAPRKSEFEGSITHDLSKQALAYYQELELELERAQPKDRPKIRSIMRHVAQGVNRSFISLKGEVYKADSEDSEGWSRALEVLDAEAYELAALREERAIIWQEAPAETRENRYSDEREQETVVIYSAPNGRRASFRKSDKRRTSPHAQHFSTTKQWQEMVSPAEPPLHRFNQIPV